MCLNIHKGEMSCVWDIQAELEEEVRRGDDLKRELLNEKQLRALVETTVQSLASVVCVILALSIA